MLDISLGYVVCHSLFVDVSSIQRSGCTKQSSSKSSSKNCPDIKKLATVVCASLPENGWVERIVACHMGGRKGVGRPIFFRI